MYTWYGYRSPLDNARYTKFTVERVQFHSMDQYKAAKKAELFQDEQALDAVMMLEKPLDCRFQPVYAFDQATWDSQMTDYLIVGLMAKVRKNFFH